MSECIICKGDNGFLVKKGFNVKEIDDFLRRGLFWIGLDVGCVWTFDYYGKGIDTIITEAQSQMQEGIRYEDTQIYEVINLLIDNNISFAMWYDIYYDNLYLCESKEEVLDKCFN